MTAFVRMVTQAYNNFNEVTGVKAKLKNQEVVELELTLNKDIDAGDYLENCAEKLVEIGNKFDFYVLPKKVYYDKEQYEVLLVDSKVLEDLHQGLSKFIEEYRTSYWVLQRRFDTLSLLAELRDLKELMDEVMDEIGRKSGYAYGLKYKAYTSFSAYVKYKKCKDSFVDITKRMKEAGAFDEKLLEEQSSQAELFVAE